jgi:quercetin dioxygenase-like cupin family protein
MSTAALDRMHIPEGVGEAMACFGTTVTFKVTRHMSRGAYTIFETSAPPGTGIPMHIHHKDEESIFVIEGRIIVRVGELACKAGKGDVLHLPARVPHGWRAIGVEPARLLMTVEVAPGSSYEEMFRQAACIGPEDAERDTKRLVAIAALANSELILPLEMP